MTAQLPHGLIRVVSASHTEITSTDPADIIFERKRALFNFWKGIVFHPDALLPYANADLL